MKSTPIPPNTNSAYLIKRFLFLEAAYEHEVIEDKYIPDGHMTFVFNFEGKVQVSNKNICYPLPPYFIVIPAMHSLKIRTFPPMDSMIVLCKASVLTRIFDIDLTQHSSQPFIDGQHLVPNELWLEMKSKPNQRQQLFEDFISNKISRPYRSDNIDTCYQNILESKGETQVNALLKQLDINPRSFRRNFLSRVGINAKTLSRVVRINYLWDCYLKGKKADFQNMVYDGNYYDQAHLIHDFKKIVGEAPSHFFNKEQEKLIFISGKIVN